VPVIVRKPKLGKLEYKQIVYKYHINILKKTQDFKTQLKEFDFEIFKKKYDYLAKETKGKISDSGMQSEISENLEQYHALRYNFTNFIYDLAKALYYRYTPKTLLSDYKNELEKIHTILNENYNWIINNPVVAIKDVVNFVASHFAYIIEYETETIEDLNTINLLEWTSPAFINYGGGKFLPKIAKSQVQRLQKRPNRMVEDFEDKELEKLIKEL